MKRRLIVMRHAKSSWNSDAPTDHARPLNKRGRHDTPRVAARLAELGWTPQLILSSDSERTRQTGHLLTESFADDVPVEFLPALYHAGMSELSAELSCVPDDIRIALALGHNPGWEEVIERLTGDRVVMKTSSAALLEGQGGTWAEAVADEASWRIWSVLHAREL